MSFLRERQSRHFFLSLIALSVSLLVFGFTFCVWQTQNVKEIMLSHDSAFVGALLEQGVSQDTIASAIAGVRDNDQGRRFLIQLGYTEKTAARFLPAVSGFRSAALRSVVLCIMIFIGLLFALCLVFHYKREQSYHQAENVIRMLLKGDFSAHLPRSGEGSLYQLFGSIDNLASALQAKGEEERRAKEFLKKTISDISHQLKTPLTALNMYNEIIANEPDNPAVIIEFSQKTSLALERMEQLIQSLLKIAQLDAKSIVFEKKQHRIIDIVDKAVEELTTRADNEQKRIVINGQKDLEINCDLQWTSEAVGNIVKNALDHTYAGGHIRISWECTAAMVRILIADDGEGIAPEELHHIFKRFFRSKNSKDAKGVGLGLSLAKSIIEGQGGILSVQSTPNSGTSFTISFLTEM
jgi:signal transduction histidine kinase